jgi:hypothetical protein
VKLILTIKSALFCRLLLGAMISPHSGREKIWLAAERIS